MVYLMYHHIGTSCIGNAATCCDLVELLLLLFDLVTWDNSQSGGAGRPSRESFCLHCSVHTTWWLKTDTPSAYLND